MKRMTGFGIIGLLIGIGFMFIAFWNKPVLRRYVVRSSKIPSDRSIKMVLITDLHSHFYGKNQKGIVDLIEVEKPDLIALVGDIADSRSPITGAYVFVQAIQNLAPIYYVTGNHEIGTGKQSLIKHLFSGLGAHVLESTSERIEMNGITLLIGGVDDPDLMKRNHPEANWDEKVLADFRYLQREPNYCILLSHRPERIHLYEQLGFDLVLSGHAHGGQIRIPFLLNGLFAPHQGLFPKYAGGMYIHNTFTHIVSRGLSFNLTRPRVFNPPEVVVIKLESGESSFE